MSESLPLAVVVPLLLGQQSTDGSPGKYRWRSGERTRRYSAAAAAGPW